MGQKRSNLKDFEKEWKKMKKILQKVARVVELDLTNSALVFLGHIWYGWSIRYPKKGQEWPKMVKNDIFYHTHMGTQKIQVCSQIHPEGV